LEIVELAAKEGEARVHEELRPLLKKARLAKATLTLHAQALDIDLADDLAARHFPAYDAERVRPQ
jgi:hypothetical protein